MPNMKNQQLDIPFGVAELFGTFFEIIVAILVLTYNTNKWYKQIINN